MSSSGPFHANCQWPEPSPGEIIIVVSYQSVDMDNDAQTRPRGQERAVAMYSIARKLPGTWFVAVAIVRLILRWPITRSFAVADRHLAVQIANDELTTVESIAAAIRDNAGKFVVEIAFPPSAKRRALD